MANNRIILIGQDKVIFKEAIATGNITPGMVISSDTNGKVVARPAATKVHPLKVAINNEIMGVGIDTDYVANDTVLHAIVPSGGEFYGLTNAGAVAIAVGDLLKVVNGLLQTIAADEELLAVAVAKQAVTQASGVSQRIVAEAL